MVAQPQREGESTPVRRKLSVQPQRVEETTSLEEKTGVQPQETEEMVSLQGVPMTEEAFEQLIAEESPYRYELIDGMLYDMTGSSPEHSALASRIEQLLAGQLGICGPCRLHHEQYVAVPGHAAVVPDVVLTCDVGDWDKDKRLKPFKIRSPLLVVEVLSPSTEHYDHTEKFARYRCCPTLEVYLLVSQGEPQIEVYRRAQEWRQECFTAEHTIKLDQLDLKLPVSAIYAGIL